MKLVRILAILVSTLLCLSCSQELAIDGGWDMIKNNPITLNFGSKGGSSTLKSLNFDTWKITEIAGETIPNIVTAEVVDDNKIEILVAENKNTISYRILVESPEKPGLVGEIIINQNVKSKSSFK